MVIEGKSISSEENRLPFEGKGLLIETVIWINRNKLSVSQCKPSLKSIILATSSKTCFFI
jgi:hypothetical protein